MMARDFRGLVQTQRALPGPALVAIDLGGTLEDTWEAKRTWYRSRGIELGPDARGRREVVSDTGGCEALYEEMVGDVYSDGSVMKHQAVAGAPEALKALAQCHALVVLSSRHVQKRALTVRWLESRRLLTFITDIVCLGAVRPKLQWCVERGAAFLIDDDPRHLEANTGASAVAQILYSPSASGPKVAPGIQRAGSWAEVARFVRDVTSRATVARSP